ARQVLGLGVSAQGLAAQRRGQLGALGAFDNLFHQLLERLQLPLGVEVAQVRRRVVRAQLLADAAVARAHHVARRKVQQAGVVGGANKIEQVRYAGDVRCQSVAQV